MQAPHPLKGSGRLTFELPNAAHVEVGLYDLAGRHVRPVMSGMWRPAGRQSIALDTSNLAPGLYLVWLHMGLGDATPWVVVLDD